jgi:diadenosine tetraphosphate (Ap4A) HIT family hydrolase
MTDCYACLRNETPSKELPPRELVFDDGNCRVVHAFGSAIPGWLVVVCRRQITSMSQVTPQEATVLGPLLSVLSAALDDVLGARKAYVAFLAQADSFEHLHVHMVPRNGDDDDGSPGEPNSGQSSPGESREDRPNSSDSGGRGEPSEAKNQHSPKPSPRVEKDSDSGFTPEQEQRIRKLIREGMGEEAARAAVLGKGWVEL